MGQQWESLLCTDACLAFSCFNLKASVIGMLVMINVIINLLKSFLLPYPLMWLGKENERSRLRLYRMSKLFKISMIHAYTCLTNQLKSPNGSVKAEDLYPFWIEWSGMSFFHRGMDYNLVSYFDDLRSNKALWFKFLKETDYSLQMLTNLCNTYFLF